ncbi:hypothetical protein ACET3Z_017187 [Daucus carota]
MEKLDSMKKNSTNGKKDYDGDEGVERRRARRERSKLRTKKTENGMNGGVTVCTSDEKVIDSAGKIYEALPDMETETEGDEDRDRERR